MGNVFKEIREKRGIIKSEAALQPDFLPAELPAREAQIKQLALALAPAANGEKPGNAFIHGTPGTGKTSVVKKVFAELNEYSSKPWTAFVNCWQSSTKMAILTHLSEQSEAGLPRRGLSSDEVMRRVVEMIKREKRVPIVALDEVDQLFAKKEEGVLYDLLRAQETWGLSFTLVLITNNPEIVSQMDRRVRSSFTNTELAFQQYTPNQLKAILKARAEIALVPGSYDEEALALCAAHAAKQGDARMAIETLFRSAKLAEQKSLDKLTAATVREVSSKITQTSTAGYQAKLEKLSDLEKTILEVLKKANKPLTSGDLYEKIQKQLPNAAERTLREHVTEMEKRGVILTEEKQGASGRTRIISLK
ncbi:MAG TPA: AAA family ATPase [Candidatus Norongarragalinales archaeon]|jgi:cell division control protein 6|nr:AAA family ATPase [Candidatus Norongarragalinales archaeon]